MATMVNASAETTIGSSRCSSCSAWCSNNGASQLTSASPRESRNPDETDPIAITAAIGFGGLLVSLLGRATIGRNAVGLSAANADGNVQALAQLLFSTEGSGN